MNKKTRHIIIAAAIVCYFLFLIGMIWYFNRSTDEDATQTDATMTDVSDDVISDSETDTEELSIEPSEKLALLLESGLTVQFDGNVLDFPCEYTDILNEEDGWELHGDGLYDSAVSFGMDTLDYEVLLYMPQEDTGSFETLSSVGCSGIGITLLDSKEVSIETAPMFTISSITWEDSKEDVIAVFGEPSYTNEIADDDGNVIYTYMFYQAEYDDKTYILEFVEETGIGIASMDIYYLEENQE